jgi:predicted CoA-binding protein
MTGQPDDVTLRRILAETRTIAVVDRCLMVEHARLR